MIKFGLYPDGFVQIFKDDVLTFVCRGRDVLYAEVDRDFPTFAVIKLDRALAETSRSICCDSREGAGKTVEYVMSKMAEDQK